MILEGEGVSSRYQRGGAPLSRYAIRPSCGMVFKIKYVILVQMFFLQRHKKQNLTPVFVVLKNVYHHFLSLFHRFVNTLQKFACINKMKKLRQVFLFIASSIFISINNESPSLS